MSSSQYRSHIDYLNGGNSTNQYQYATRAYTYTQEPTYPKSSTKTTTTTTTRRYIFTPLTSNQLSTAPSRTTSIRSLSSSNSNRQPYVTNTISFQPGSSTIATTTTTSGSSGGISGIAANIDAANQNIFLTSRIRSSSLSRKAAKPSSVINIVNVSTDRVKASTQDNAVNTVEFDKIDEKICQQAKNISKLLFNDKDISNLSDVITKFGISSLKHAQKQSEQKHQQQHNQTQKKPQSSYDYLDSNFAQNNDKNRKIDDMNKQFTHFTPPLPPQNLNNYNSNFNSNFNSNNNSNNNNSNNKNINNITAPIQNNNVTSITNTSLISGINNTASASSTTSTISSITSTSSIANNTAPLNQLPPTSSETLITSSNNILYNNTAATATNTAAAASNTNYDLLLLENSKPTDFLSASNALPRLSHSLSYDSYKKMSNFNTSFYANHDILTSNMNNNLETTKAAETSSSKQSLTSVTNPFDYNYNYQQQPSTTTEPSKTSNITQNYDSPLYDTDAFIKSFSNNIDPKQLTEYRTSLHIGRFNISDITVQLIDENDDKLNKKLVVHCYHVEPIQNKAGNYLKKEFKREISMPSNVDISTLESFYYNEILTIKCKYKQNQQPTSPHLPKTMSTASSLSTSKSQTNASQEDAFNFSLAPTKVNEVKSSNGTTTNSITAVQNSPTKASTSTGFSTLDLLTSNATTAPSATTSISTVASNTSPTYTTTTSTTSTTPNGINGNGTKSILKSNGQSTSQNVETNIVKQPLYDNLNDNLSSSTSDKRTNGNKSQQNESATEILQNAASPNIQRSNSQKSVRFDLDDTEDKSEDNQAQPNGSLDSLIRDGFNCLTKDSLENLYLTYFFKLPSCSPSDRTQVKIENHSIVRLKIIQEKKLKESPNQKLDANNATGLTQLDDSDKIMFREFSRCCRLPTHLFRFDEGGVTVSFMNDVWVRVEVPIIEILNMNHFNQLQNQNLLTNQQAAPKSASNNTVNQHEHQNNAAITSLTTENQKSATASASAPANGNGTKTNKDKHKEAFLSSDLSVCSNSESISAKNEIRF